jgi:beta-lactam-binding protein with PASTA domain
MVPRFLTRPVVPALLLWGFVLLAAFLLIDHYLMPRVAGQFRPVTAVPLVVGLDSEAAADTLRAHGLRFAVDSAGEHSRRVPAGRVLSQTPVSGSVVKQGRRVWVKLSLGRERIIHPGRDR